MNKLCQECGKEFTVSNNPVSLQKNYCSKLCKSRAGMKRYKERLINQALNEEKTDRHENKIRGISNPGESRNYQDMERESGRNFYSNGHNHVTERSNIEDDRQIFIKYIEATIEAQKMKLERDDLERQLAEARRNLIEYESEENEEGEDSAGSSGWLSGVDALLPKFIEQYDQNPNATIGFVTQTIWAQIDEIQKRFTNGKTKR